MRDFRIGTDIKVKWHVTINEGTVPIEGADLTLQLVNPLGQRAKMPFSILDGKVVAIVYGKDQTMLGAYALTLWLNYGKADQTAIDHIDAFRLVASSNLIEGEDDCDNLQTGATVNLSGMMSVGVQGASAYEIWLRNGHTGTEDDFLAWLKGPQGDPGAPGAPGEPGSEGNGIDHIALTGTDGNKDLYTIFFTNGNTFNFFVNHGKDATIDAYTKEQINALLDKKAGATSKVLHEYGGSESEMDTNLAITALSYAVIIHYHDVEEELKEKVPTTRTINEEPLTDDIWLRSGNIPHNDWTVEEELTQLRVNKVSTDDVVQTTGTATDKVMSQKATTDAVNAVGEDAAQALNIINGQHGAVGIAPVVQETGDSTTAVMSQDAVTKALASAVGGDKPWSKCYDTDLPLNEIGYFLYDLPLGTNEVAVLITRTYVSSNTGNVWFYVVDENEKAFTIGNSYSVNSSTNSFHIYKWGDFFVCDGGSTNNSQTSGFTVNRKLSTSGNDIIKPDFVFAKLRIRIATEVNTETKIQIFAR